MLLTTADAYSYVRGNTKGTDAIKRQPSFISNAFEGLETDTKDPIQA